jgi:hypothetical protein
MRGARALAAFLLSAYPTAAPEAAAEEAYLLIVTGLSGEPKTADALHEQAAALRQAAVERYGLQASNVTYLGESPERDSAQIAAKSTRENVSTALAKIAERARPGDAVWLVLLGHGSFQSGESRFNLPGPDLTAEDWKRALERFGEQKLVFVNAASASGEFVAALAKKPNGKRVVVTATKSGVERNETIFGRHFVEAFSGSGADKDKNGRVSILEAFEYAKAEVAREYEKGNRLLTEHAVLEDGSGGELARSLFLAAEGGRVAELSAGDPQLSALLEERKRIEARVEALKAKKGSLPAETYEQELEKLLVELALKSEAIRKASKGQP